MIRLPKQKPFHVTPLHDLLLHGSPVVPVGLYHLHLATAEQLTRLHYKPGMLNTVKARLKELADNGYVQADSVPTRRFRSPYYYTMGQKGMRYLEAAGLDVNTAYRASEETDKHWLFIDHALDLSDVLIAAVRLPAADARFYLAQFTHERELKRTPYKADGISLIPDAFLDFRYVLPDGHQRRMPVLLEHDRGTEQQQHFRRRIRAYLSLFRNNGQQSLFGVQALTVAFTTFVSHQRLEQMRTWTAQELAAAGAPKAAGMLFLFAHLPRPLNSRALCLEPYWYTPYQGGPLQLLSEG